MATLDYFLFLSGETCTMKRILVIDDDHGILDVVRLFLESKGYEVFTASQGDNAVNNAVSCCPQVILLDVYLKDSNGVEICHRLKANPLTRNIPVIMFSGEVSDHLILRKCAAEDFIEKPYDEKTLVAKIEALLDGPKELSV